MLKIPAIDLIEGGCVRLLQGDYRQKIPYKTDPVEQALRFQAAGFSRLHVIDLEGAKTGSGRNREAVKRVLSASRVPVQVGGGIREEGDVEELLEAGANYLILGTMVLTQPDAVARWLRRWGPEPFLVSLDLRNGRLQTDGWLEESEEDVPSVLARIRKWGIREIICTDVEKDGTLEQPNYSTYRELRSLMGESMGLLAAGGVSRPEHLPRLAQEGVTGAIIGRALYEGEFTWEEMLSAG